MACFNVSGRSVGEKPDLDEVGKSSTCLVREGWLGLDTDIRIAIVAKDFLDAEVVVGRGSETMKLRGKRSSP
jgi:hypothetical protein